MGRLISIGIIPCLLLCMIQGASLAQAPDSTGTALIEDGYIEVMKEYLALKLKVDSDVRMFKLTTPGDDYDIRPNASAASRISLNYRFISLSYSYIPGFIPGNNDDDLKGETKATSYGLHLDHGHWIQDLSYTRANGFYLENTSDYIDGWREGEDSYILFPELLYKAFHGYTAYKHNKRFSFKALGTQTERQRRSAGCLLPALRYSYYVIDNRIVLTGENSSQKSGNVEVMLALGYFHTFVLSERFYFSAGLAPAAGMIYTKLTTRMPEGDYTDRYDHPIYRLEAQGAIGYNSRRFFAGSQVLFSWEKYDQAGNTSVVVSERVSYQFFIGYRFDAPGFLDRWTGAAAEMF